MLTRTKESQVDKARNTVRDVVSYAQDIARDEQLRADVRAAFGHGTKAGDRIKEDVDAGSVAKRLADDKKLRRNLRAMLDDLEDAGDRMRRRRPHRFRNVMLVLAASVAALVALPKLWPWLKERTSDAAGAGGPDPEPLT